MAGLLLIRHHGLSVGIFPDKNTKIRSKKNNIGQFRDQRNNFRVLASVQRRAKKIAAFVVARDTGKDSSYKTEGKRWQRCSKPCLNWKASAKKIIYLQKTSRTPEHMPKHFSNRGVGKEAKKKVYKSSEKNSAPGQPASSGQFFEANLNCLSKAGTWASVMGEAMSSSWG